MRKILEEAILEVYVKIENYPGEINLNQFKAIVINSDIEYSGKFSCSNEKVNKLLVFAKGSVDTLYGPIASGWEFNEDILSVSVSIPYNTTAKLYLPGICEQDLDDTINFENEEGQLVIMLGTGEYSFAYAYHHMDDE